jgi:hypothetical protein
MFVPEGTKFTEAEQKFHEKVVPPTDVFVMVKSSFTQTVSGRVNSACALLFDDARKNGNNKINSKRNIFLCELIIFNYSINKKIKAKL